MNRTQHPSNNGVLGAPPGQTIEECRALPVTHCTLDGAPCVASFWQPDAGELARLNAGKPVILWVQGRTHAPLALTVDT